MLKPLLFVSTVVLFGIFALFTPGSISQDTTPAHAAGKKNPVKPADKSQDRAKEIYGAGLRVFAMGIMEMAKPI